MSTVRKLVKDNEVELDTFSSSESDVTSDANEITKDELITSYLSDAFVYPIYKYVKSVDTSSAGIVSGVTIGATVGGIFGGPPGAIGGGILGYFAGGVIGGAIQGGYDGVIKGGFIGALQGFCDGASYGWKNVCGNRPRQKTEAEIQHNAFIAEFTAKFVTPLDYKETVDQGLHLGGLSGTFFGILGGPETMCVLSSAFGVCGSVMAGACKGGYDGLVKGGIQGFISGASFNGFIEGAAIGYFNYHSQYNSNTTYPNPVVKHLDKHLDEASIFITGYLNICNFITDSVNAVQDSIRTAYQSFNLFSPSTQNKVAGMEYFIADSPEDTVNYTPSI